MQFVEKPNEWYLVQKAGARITMEKWTENIPEKGKIVFIGRNFKISLINKLLDDCTDAPKSVMFM